MTAERDIPAAHASMLSHAKEPERARNGDFVFIYTLAVVLDDQDEGWSHLFEGDRDRGRLGMADDVGKGFLCDAENRRSGGWIQLDSFEVRHELAPNACVARECRCQPLQSRDQPQIVQDRRSQLGRDSTNRLGCGVNKGR